MEVQPVTLSEEKKSKPQSYSISWHDVSRYWSSAAYLASALTLGTSQRARSTTTFRRKQRNLKPALVDGPFPIAQPLLIASL